MNRLFATIIVSWFWSCPPLCYAAEINVDFSVPLVDLDGKPIHEPGPEGKGDGPVLTLGRAAGTALMFRDQRENISGVDQVSRWVLAQKIISAKAPVALTIDEAKILKDQLPKAFGPMIGGQALTILEPPKLDK
jgi:hypothetical protein